MEKVLKTFNFEGKDYEIRLIFDGVAIQIRAYLGSKPANGILYGISINSDTHYDFKTVRGTDVIKKFVQFAEADVREKLQEGFIEAMKDVSKK